jgi:YidC/Oxa1 family membrane protein insertase
MIPCRKAARPPEGVLHPFLLFMDRKSILVVALSLGLIVLWQGYLVPKLYPPKPVPTNAVATATGPLTGASNTVASAALAAAPANVTVRTLATNGPEELLSITNETTVFTFSSRSGGVKRFEMRGYPMATGCKATGATNLGMVALNDGAPLPAFTLLGGGFEGSDWKLTPVGAGLIARADLPNGLTVIKEYLPGPDYILRHRLVITNAGTMPVSLPEHEYVVGTATHLTPHEPAIALGTHWQNGDKPELVGEGWFANRTLGCFPGTPRTEYRAGDGNVKWAAVNNQFFALAVIPAQPAKAFRSLHLELPPPSAAVLAEDPRANPKPIGFESALVYPAAVLAPGQSVERSYTVFAGPKEYNTLVHLAKETKTDVDSLMGFSKFFGFFAKALLLSMNGLHSWGLSYGVAIIVITVIIKTLFFPLTHASTKSMKRMALLQPEMAKIKEKYKDDPQKVNQKTMEFMREHRINPVAGCIPIVIQIPVFIGFYQMLNAAIELRGTGFLWACDLSQPDTLFMIPGTQLAFNLLPFFWAASTWWQTSLTPVSPGVDPAQQKMMKFMPFMFFFFLYNMASGLTLYWTVQNLLGVLQTKLTKPGKDPAADKLPPAKRNKLK